MNSRNFINRYDYIIFIVVLAIGAYLIFKDTVKPEYIKIISYKETTIYPIYMNRIIEPKLDYPLKIEIKNGRVRVIEAHCPNKICEGMGWIDKAGDSIVCVPNRLVIKLIGGGEGEIDGISQ